MNEEKNDLCSLRITLEQLRVVAERSHGHCWFPDLLRFSTGELMLNHSSNSDRIDSNCRTTYFQ